MAGINVLSDTLKGGTKLEKTSTSKGNDITDSPGNAATAFAAMLSGSMNPIANPRGQNSSVVGQESEEKQSADNPILSVQNPNGQGNMLGYGNFAFSLLSQPMLQSELPAGKEANSGINVSQGTEGLATANEALIIKPNILGNNLELAILNLVSQASDEISAQSGVTTSKSQGDNPGITELDKYRRVIADLLVALSGEITDNSPKGTTSSSSEGTETKNLGQNMAKIVQGWMMLIDEGAEDGQITSGQATESMKEAISGDNAALSSRGNNPISSVSNGVKDIRQDLAKIVQDWMTLTNDVPENGSISTSPDQNRIQSLVDVLTEFDLLTKGQIIANSELNARASALLAAFNPIVNSQGIKDMKAPQAAETFQAEGDMIDPMSKGYIDTPTPMSKPKGMGNALEPVVLAAKDTTDPIKSQQKSAEAGLRESKPLSVQGTLNEEILKGDCKQSVELSGGKEVQNQNPSAGVGVLSNIVAANVADGKIVAIPVFEQIATVFRVQITDRHQEMKELDIQLHPADLGKIQIALRWENGQVHLQVQASEAATSQMLQNQLSDLRHTLTSQGVNCGMLQMGQGGERQQNSREDSSQRAFKQKLDIHEDEDQIPGLSSPLSIGQDGINRINVTA